MANTIFQLKRNPVSGIRPTTSTLSSGELAFNTTDGILFSANITNIFEIGGNLTSTAIGNSNSRFTVNTTVVAIGNSQGLIANGSFGTANQVLTSNGSGVYWSTISDVNVATQYVWSNTQTFSNTITFSQVINGTANNANNLGGVSLSTIQSQITGNAATAYSNAVSNAAALYQTTAGLSANVLVLTSNAAGFLGNSSGTLTNIASWVTGNAATAYTNATTFASNASNITTGTLPDARLSSAIVNTSGNFTIAGNINFTSANNLFSTIRVSGNATINAIIANGSTGTANQILISNGSGVYWGSSSGASSIRQTFTANATVNTTFTIVGGYSPGYIDVYKNGVKLINGTDVDVTSGSIITLAAAAPSNTVIDVVAFNAGTLSTGSYSYSSYISQQFTANGTGNTFTISGGYIPSAIEVFVGGVKQVPGSDVTVTSGSTVNLTTPPLNGQIVDVFGYQGVGSLISGATYVRQTFTANSTVNTSFTITGGYTVNYIDVYKNGVKLINGTEVTATNGSTVVLAAAALSNDIVDVVGYNSVSLAAINTTAQYTWSNTNTYQSNLTIASTSALIISNGAGIYANGTLGTNNQVLTSNGTGLSWTSKSIMNYRTVTSNTTVLSTDNLIVANGTLTINLPAASTVAGQQFYIKNINNSNGIITVLPNGSELIDGYANATIRYYNTMFGVISIGTGWVIF
jgi:hypothetical protein